MAGAGAGAIAGSSRITPAQATQVLQEAGVQNPSAGLITLIANNENLDGTIPKNKDDYEVTIQENHMNNFSNFFGRSYLEQVSVDQEDIVFQKKYAEPLRMRISDFGAKAEVYDNIVGPIMLEGSSMSEIMYFTKYVGNYNITKIGDKFVFENGKYAVALEKV